MEYYMNKTQIVELLEQIKKEYFAISSPHILTCLPQDIEKNDEIMVLGNGVFQSCLNHAINENLIFNCYNSILNKNTPTNMQIHHNENFFKIQLGNQTIEITRQKGIPVDAKLTILLPFFNEKYIKQYVKEQYNKQEHLRDFIIPIGPEAIFAAYKWVSKPQEAARDFGLIDGEPLTLDENLITQYKNRLKNDSRPICNQSFALVLSVFGEYAFNEKVSLSQLYELVSYNTLPMKSDSFVKFIDKNYYKITDLSRHEPTDFYDETISYQTCIKRARLLHNTLCSIDKETTAQLSINRLERILGENGQFLDQKFFDYVNILEGISPISGKPLKSFGIMDGVLRQAIINKQETPITEKQIKQYIIETEQFLHSRSVPKDVEDPLMFIAKQNGTKKQLQWLREYGQIPGYDEVFLYIPKEQMANFDKQKFMTEWNSIVEALWPNKEAWFCEPISRFFKTLVTMYYSLGYETTKKLVTECPQKLSQSQYLNYSTFIPLKQEAGLIRKLYKNDGEGNYILHANLSETVKYELFKAFSKIGGSAILSQQSANKMFRNVKPVYCKAFEQYIKENSDEICEDPKLWQNTATKQKELIKQETLDKAFNRFKITQPPKHTKVRPIRDFWD